MKKTAICALLAIFSINSFASSGGKILPGKLSGKPNDDAYYVNITNQDTVTVFITTYADAKDPYGPAYSPITTGEWHIGFNPPYTYLNIQAACYPGGPAKAYGNFYNGQRFVVPYGICSAAKGK